MNQQEQKRIVVREYKQRLASLEKPEMRITKQRKWSLLTGAALADIADAIAGTIPVIGDIVTPAVIYQFFNFWFRRYNVDTSEFLSSGRWGATGKITTWVLDSLVGIVPVIGDIADLLFASWLLTIRGAVKSVRKKDKEKIAKYEKQRRKLRSELQQQLARIDMETAAAQQRMVDGVQTSQN